MDLQFLWKFALPYYSQEGICFSATFHPSPQTSLNIGSLILVNYLLEAITERNVLPNLKELFQNLRLIRADT